MSVSENNIIESLHSGLHVLYAALNGLVEDGGNEEARVALADFAGGLMAQAGRLINSHD